MSVEETEQTLRGYLEALLNGGDFAAYFDEDVTWTTMESGEQIRGRAAVRDHIIRRHSQEFRAEPELKSIAFGDGVCGLEAGFPATHTAEFAGIPATGKRVNANYAMFYEVKEGRITALRAYFPELAIAKQLRGDSGS